MTATPAKYRGLSGAISYGVFIFAVVATLSVIAVGVIWGLTGEIGPARALGRRVLIFGIPYSIAAFLCRWIAGAEFNSLAGFKLQRGDIGIAGALLGMLAVGAQCPKSWQAALSGGEGEGVTVGRELKLAGPTFDGQSYDIADQRGQVVVVDFWATWCGPCVRELPSVIALYEKNKDKGLRIVGVNLDNTRDDLAEFLQRRPLPWPQIMFTEPAKMGWNNPFVKEFGIDGIPYVIVVDREGRVAAADVRGRALETAVAKALGGEAAGPHQPIHERVFDWFLRGLFAADPLYLAGGIIGGALIVLALELLIRRAFK
jgi:thiol-disulfide isomerase/thioredoxin